MVGSWIRRCIHAVCACGLLTFVGCSQFRLPAIDPSGERVFVQGGTTTLESCAPKPAFSAPPKPQPCPATTFGNQAPVAYAPSAAGAPCGTATGPNCPPSTPGMTQMTAPVAVPGACNSPGGQRLVGGKNQLKATPARLVAPVGSEVVIVAGYCGPDGHFLTKENLEWTLAQDSVGHIVEVGGGAYPTVQKIFHESPDKRSSNYALSRTFTESKVLTRGTPNPSDDVRVGKGQAWISVTSPTEGTSHVTILAPEQEDWERRRQTSTIHWIDAQWQFPGPAITSAGQTVALVTTVTRATNGSPLSGWLVRYSLPLGANAAFSNGAAEIEVPADQQGQAMAEVVPRTNDGSTVQVQVQIVRPSLASGDLPKTVVGQGTTTVTWSAPGLSLRVLGPDSMQIGQTATFRVEVTNMGDLPARDVTLSDALPPTLKYVSSNPPGQVFGERMEWRLGDLPARTTRTVDVSAQAVRGGDARYCFKARSADGLASESCLDRLKVYAPTLQLEVFGPQTAEVGQEVQYRVRLTNRGASLLRNVQLVDQFDPGLAHAQGERSPISQSLGEMAAGDVKEVAVTFVVRQAGTLCHTVQATAEGTPPASMRACLAARVGAGGPGGAVPGAALRILLSGPRQATVDELAEFKFTVVNTSSGPLSNVRVVYQNDKLLDSSNASQGFQAAKQQLTWVIGTLQRDERREYMVQARCTGPSQAAAVRVTVLGDPNLQASEIWTTAIAAKGTAGTVPPGAPPPPGGAAPPANEPNVTGDLAVTVTELENPTVVNKPTQFVIIIKNDRNVPDRNVTLRFRLPDGVDLPRVTVTGPTRNPKVSPDGRTWEMEAVSEMRAGESLVPYYVKVTPTAAGQSTLEVEVTSWRSPQPKRASARVTVTAQ